MGGMFSSPKSVKAPPPLPPPPLPATEPEGEDITRKKRPRGRAKTFLTGELTPETGKKTTLG